MDAAKYWTRSRGFIGTSTSATSRKLQPVVAAINALEAEVKSLSDENSKPDLRSGKRVQDA